MVGLILLMIFYVQYSISVFWVLESSSLNLSNGYCVLIWVAARTIYTVLASN